MERDSKGRFIRTKPNYKELHEHSEKARLEALELYMQQSNLVTWLEPRLGFLYRWYYRKHKKEIQKGTIYD